MMLTDVILCCLNGHKLKKAAHLKGINVKQLQGGNQCRDKLLITRLQHLIPFTGAKIQMERVVG